MKISHWLSTLVALVFLFHPARAQHSDAGATIEKVGSGVYAIIHADAIYAFPEGTTDWPHSNVGVIVGAKCVLVVDSDFYPSRATDDIALIRRMTSVPICYLVNTHWHGDHTHVNGVYQKAFPNLKIIGTELNRGFIAVNQARYPKRVISAESGTRKTLARYRGFLASGTDRAGRELSDSLRTLLVKVIGALDTQLREFSIVEVVPPTMTFAGEKTLDLGGVLVRIVSRGRANSPDDVTIAVPEQRVLFTGDIVVHPVAFAFGVHPPHWVKVLGNIERENPRIVIPGHGPLMRDLRWVRMERELLDSVIARVTRLATQGRNVAEITKEIHLDDLRARWVKAGDANAAAYWEDSIAGPLIESTYQGIIGSRC